MSLLSFCQWLNDTQIGTSIRESAWVFPIIETSHVLGLSLSVGVLLLSDLRLMGVALRKYPASEVWRYLLPWLAVGFTIMFVSGIFLFWSQALKAYNSVFFRAKVVLLILAGVNAVVYHSTIYRKMDAWDTARVPPMQARLAGWISLILWAGIIAAGRTMAYTF